MVATQTQEIDRRNGEVNHLNCYAVDCGDGEWDIHDEATGRYLTTWYEEEISEWQRRRLSGMQDAAPYQNAYS